MKKIKDYQNILSLTDKEYLFELLLRNRIFIRFLFFYSIGNCVIKTREYMFARRMCATWVKRHASFLCLSLN